MIDRTKQAKGAWILFVVALAVIVALACLFAPPHDEPGGPSYSAAVQYHFKLTE